MLTAILTIVDHRLRACTLRSRLALPAIRRYRFGLVRQAKASAGPVMPPSRGKVTMRRRRRHRASYACAAPDDQPRAARPHVGGIDLGDFDRRRRRRRLQALARLPTCGHTLVYRFRWPSARRILEALRRDNPGGSALLIAASAIPPRTYLRPQRRAERGRAPRSRAACSMMASSSSARPHRQLITTERPKRVAGDTSLT